MESGTIVQVILTGRVGRVVSQPTETTLLVAFASLDERSSKQPEQLVVDLADVRVLYLP